MNKIILSLGSNLADGQAHVAAAIEWLESVGCQCEVSSIYSSPSINGDGTMYFNAVVRGLFQCDADELSVKCKEYEATHGRVHVKGMPVSIDIDVVVCNDCILRPKDASRYYFTRGVKELS